MENCNNNKASILLNATGDAPIITKRNWKLDRNKTVEWVLEFIRKYIKLSASDSLFLYINQSFSPSLDMTMGNLHDTFSVDGKLIFHYATNETWG